MDLVTGEFQVTSLNDFAMVCGEIRNLRAREIVLTYSLSEGEERVLLGQMNLLLSPISEVAELSLIHIFVYTWPTWISTMDTA